MLKNECPAVFALVGLAACMDAAGPQPEDTQVVRSPFSVGSCATASANLTLNPQFPIGWSTPTTYDKCGKSYVVDIMGVDSTIAGGMITAAWGENPHREVAASARTFAASNGVSPAVAGSGFRAWLKTPRTS